MHPMHGIHATKKGTAMRKDEKMVPKSVYLIQTSRHTSVRLTGIHRLQGQLLYRLSSLKYRSNTKQRTTHFVPQ